MQRVGRVHVFALWIAVALLGSCASEDEVSQSFGDALEEALNLSPDVLFEGEYIDSINLCMEVNGFDGYQHSLDDDKVPLLGGEFVEGPDDERDYISEYGSGLVYLMFAPEDQLLPPRDEAVVGGDSSADRDDYLAKESFVLDQQADVYPRDGIVKRGGCIDYAEHAIIVDHPVMTNQRSLSERYANFMSEAFFQSPEFIALTDVWVACMHDAGFGEVAGWKAEYDQIHADAAELQEEGKTLQTEEVQALLEKDRQTALASFDCHTQISDRRLQLKNEKAAEFAEGSSADVDALMNEVSS